MAKSVPLLVAVLLSFLIAELQGFANDQSARSLAEDLHSALPTAPRYREHRLHSKWLGQKPLAAMNNNNNRRASSPFDALHAMDQFKGCVDPSEPFQCPHSEKCVALQFICDGHAGDCPGNLDENEETCIAVKRPAKENIEKFLHAEYTLHGTKLFAFLFGEKLANNIEENNTFWLDTVASAFSVSKTIRRFAEKTRMSPADLAHFQNVIQLIHAGRLEEIPLFVQEAVNQGLASLIEKLYESGFMDQ